MPPSEPVSELILQNVKTALEGIVAGDDYFHTVRHVEINDGTHVAGHKHPAAFIKPYDTDMDGEGETVSDGIEHRMPMDVDLVYQGRTSGPTQFERLIRDGITALYADRSRGGLATHTIIDGVSRSYPGDPQQDIYVATLRVRVVFRTNGTDLGTAI